MPTDKDLIKDTIALGGHYCNYTMDYIVVAKYMVVASDYLYAVSESGFDEAAHHSCTQTSIDALCPHMLFFFTEEFGF